MREIFKRMHVPSSTPLYFLWISIYLVAAFAAGISNSVFPSQQQKQQQRGTNDRGFFACDVCPYKRVENLTIWHSEREENRADRTAREGGFFDTVGEYENFASMFYIDLANGAHKWEGLESN